MLLLDASVPLPFTDLGALTASAVAPEALLMRRANEYLADRHPGLVAGVPERTEGGTYRVPVAVGGVGAIDPAPRGALLMTVSGSIERDETTAA